MPDIHELSASQMAASIAAGELTSRDALEHYLARLDRHNKKLNAVVVTDLEAARAVADAADAALADGRSFGALHGVPMTVKDTYEAAGMASVVGEPRLADYVSQTDATTVARLKAAGAVIFGKTNTPRLAQDVQTYNDIYGITNNPWNTERSPGGSSGGAAAALAAGIVPLELGSDLAGSIRLPAAWSGVYGHKSSYGVVPMRGHIPGPPGTLAEPDLCVAGPLARHPRDLSLMLDVLAGPPSIESAAWQVHLPRPRMRNASSFRIATYLGDDFAPLTGAMRGALDKLVDDLRGLGAEPAPLKALPGGFEQSYDLYDRLLNALVGSGLPDKLYTKARRGAKLLSLLGKDKRGTLGGFSSRATDSHRAWVADHETREKIRRDWQALFADYDVLLMPVVGVPAIAHLHEGSLFDRTIDIDGQSVAYTQLFRWIAPATLAGLPATVAPIGLSKDGLPLAVQIVGAYGTDHTTIAFAQALKDQAIGVAHPPGYD